MSTQLYNGKELEVVSDPDQLELIQRAYDIKNIIKKSYEELDEILPQIKTEVAHVGDLRKTEELESRTVIVGEPEYLTVKQKKLDFVKDAKTTKKLYKEING